MGGRTLRIIVALAAIFLAFLSYHVLDAIFSFPPGIIPDLDRIMRTVIAVMAAAIVSNILTALPEKNFWFFRWVPKQIEPVVALVFKYLVWYFAATYLIPLWGGDLAHLNAALGITGVAIALAVQDIFRNFVAFWRIVAGDYFQVGDAITVEGISGVVQNINALDTTIETAEGEASVPNSTFLQSAVVKMKPTPVPEESDLELSDEAE